MNKTALILGGSGKIGRHARTAFEHAGWTVRLYDRKTNDMVAAAQGVDVIVNGLNPPGYHDWARQIPAITQQVIEAAREAGATVIIPGNVYNLDAEGGTWSERTPHAPPTKKGRIREDMEQAYRAAGIRTIVLRAGNFIDPDSDDDVMGLLLLRELRRGRILAAGDPHVTQAYCYVPDWARAAVALAEKRFELDGFEDIPFPGHTFTVEELRGFLNERLERPLKLSAFPWWVFKLAAPFWELGREMLEMRYLFNLPHRLASEKFDRILPDFRATPLETVMLSGCNRGGAAAPDAPLERQTA